MKVSKETIIRTAILIIALINQTLTMLGKNPLPFSEEDIYALLTTVATIAAAVWSWWKNNSFTPAAIEADSFLKAVKSAGTENTEV